MTKILTHEFLTIVGPLLFVGLLYLGLKNRKLWIYRCARLKFPGATRLLVAFFEIEKATV